MSQGTDETVSAGTAQPPAKLYGNVQLGEKLGEGGMGAVYRGFHTILNRPVAVKLILSELASQPAFSVRFLREAQLAMDITAEEVVRLLDCGAQDGQYYMVMEMVDGGGLGDLLAREGALPAERAIPIALDVARGLQAAHRKGIIHRDIKPGNILLTKQGRAKIADLGLAKSVVAPPSGGEGVATQVGVAMGSPGYMAPEQIEDASSVDHRADIFALGATLYLMVTGNEAFPGKSLEQVVASTLGSSPAPLRGELARRLGPIVDKMLAKRPDQRYASYEALIADLERSLAAPAAQPASRSVEPVARTRDSLALPRSRARRRALAGGVVVAAILVAGVGLWFARRGSGVAPPSRPAGSVAASPSAPAPAPSQPAPPARIDDSLAAAATGRSRGIDDSVAPEVKAALDLAYTKELSGTPSAEVRLLAQSGHGSQLAWRSLPNGAALTSADGYRVEVRPQSAGHLYVFQVDSRGKLDLIFPRLPAARFSRGRNPVSAGVVLTLPDEKHAFHLDQRLGVEQVYAVLVSSRWEELEQALVRASRVPPRPRPVEAPVMGRDRGIGAVVEVASSAPAPGPWRLSGNKVAALVTGTKGVLVVERWFNHVAPGR